MKPVSWSLAIERGEEDSDVFALTGFHPDLPDRKKTSTGWGYTDFPTYEQAQKASITAQLMVDHDFIGS